MITSHGTCKVPVILIRY